MHNWWGKCSRMDWHFSQNKPITFYAIDRELLRIGDKDIFKDYFRSYIDHPPETVNLDPVTREKYEACLFHLNNVSRKIRFVTCMRSGGINAIRIGLRSGFGSIEQDNELKKDIFMFLAYHK